MMELEYYRYLTDKEISELPNICFLTQYKAFGITNSVGNLRLAFAKEENSPIFKIIGIDLEGRLFFEHTMHYDNLKNEPTLYKNNALNLLKDYRDYCYYYFKIKNNISYYTRNKYTIDNQNICQNKE